MEDLAPGDFLKVDCDPCHHVALLTPEALLRAGLMPRDKGSRFEGAAPVPRVREKGAGGGLGEVAGAVSVSRRSVPGD